MGHGWVAALRKSLLTGLASAALALPLVSAAPGTAGSAGLGGAFQSIITLFASIFSVQLSDQQFVWFARGIIFFVLGTVLFYAAKNHIPVFKDAKNKGAAIVVGFGLAAFSLWIPETLIMQIASMYSALFYLLLFLIPTIIAFAVAFSGEHKRPRDHMWGLISLIIVLAIYIGIRPYATVGLIKGAGWESNFAELILNFMFGAVMLATIIKLFQMVGGVDSTQADGRSWANRHLRPHLPPWLGGTRGTAPATTAAPMAPGGAAAIPPDYSRDITAANTHLATAQAALDQASTLMRNPPLAVYDEGSSSVLRIVPMAAYTGPEIANTDVALGRATVALGAARTALHRVISDPLITRIQPADALNLTATNAQFTIQSTRLAELNTARTHAITP